MVKSEDGIMNRIGSQWIVAAQLTLLLAVPAAAQDMRASLFTDIDELLAQAKQMQADVLAPRSFGEFQKLYDRAEDSLEKGQQIDRIRADLAKATEFLEKAMDATSVANVTLETAMDARADAIAAGAADHAAKLWTAAEKKFKDAAVALENGDLNAAKKSAAEAETMHREAELNAIKTNYFQETRDLLVQADKDKIGKYTPKTLQRSKDLLAEAEKGLEESRYDTDGPRTLARQAKYEVLHAGNMSELIARLEKNEMTAEDLMLKVEAAITKVAGELDLVPRFDEGYGLTTEDVLEKLDLWDRRQHRLESEIADYERTTDNLRAQISALESELGGVSKEREALEARMAAEEEVRARFAQVETLFDRREAQVYRQGNDLLIRMVGLNFDVGASEIKPENFGLLTKIQQAIKTFPGCHVSIEGHTDTLGSDEINRKISQERADAVKQYLAANMNVPASQFEAAGYGETKPIASNETEEGRTKNRRIDLVIRPDLGS
jgi:outer membrane protein OmpA-like peptidoglycan-associated protein